MRSSPAAIASGLRTLAIVVSLGVGGILTLAGRPQIGIPLLGFGAWLWRNIRKSTVSSSSEPRTSEVRSAWLIMELDHETGNLEGLVRQGPFHDCQLSDLREDELSQLYSQLSGDRESVQLLEAYMDSRSPGWREAADRGATNGSGQSSGSGPMSEKEAYEVLGLAPGAGEAEIRAAHRKLMKAVHPDSGGSTFLATRINQAKEILLG